VTARSSAVNQGPLFQDLQRVLAPDHDSIRVPEGHIPDPRAKSNEKIRILANWDPSYPGETVDWYSEYIHRTASLAVSWLQQPRNRESTEQEPMEVRGAGIYHRPGDEDTSVAVGPLDDGSLCLWDVNGASGKRGRIMGRSAPGTLSTSGSTLPGASRSRMINTGVTECVSIDSNRKKAYIAVQSGESFFSSMFFISCHMKMNLRYLVAGFTSILCLAPSFNTTFKAMK
jgi:hypothetical protein